MRSLRIIVVGLFYAAVLPAQVPFICQGDYYITLRPRGIQNTLLKVDIDPNTNEVTFRGIPNFRPIYDLNAMGYRSNDNFIYVIEQTKRSLMRISSDGSIELLRTLDEIPRLSYLAGACTPDGKYLVIAGSNDFLDITTTLIFIDLTTDEYKTREVSFSTPDALFYDMDFDPFSGICYAYDVNKRGLIRIDIERGVAVPIGRRNQGSDAMGALFFDAFGNLYGYGNQVGSFRQNTFFRISTVTGDLEVLTKGTDANQSDGCSCPYTVELEKNVSARDVSACSEVIFSFVIANASATERTGIDLVDAMPEGFEILEVVRNPFGGEVIMTDKPNEIFIKNMTIPLGIDSILVKVHLREFLDGRYENQAYLSNLPESLGGIVYSDDPTTVVRDDPTALFILPLSVDLKGQEALICPGDSLILQGQQGGVSYVWSTGETTQQIAIREPGTYWVNASTACQSVADTVVIGGAPEVSVELGDDYDIVLGDTVHLAPVVRSSGNILQYEWIQVGEKESIECKSCETQDLTPFHSSTYQLTVSNEFGCSATDFVSIDVDRNVYVWIPNAFTPNGDGFNDYFYMVGRQNYQVSSFEIFDRWGKRLFQNRTGMVNNSMDGWDGTFHGNSASPGVYVYQIMVKLADGTEELYFGDVTLLR